MFAAQIAANSFRNTINKPPENFDLHLSAHRLRQGDHMQRKILSIQQNALSIQTKENLIKTNDGTLPSLSNQPPKLTLDTLYDWSASPHENLARFADVETRQQSLLTLLDQTLETLKPTKRD